MAIGARFAKWGIGLFVFGAFPSFGIVAHYCAGARWPRGARFVQDVALWWACAWTLAAAPSKLALPLCIVGLLGVFAVGYPGYFVFDAIWPSDYHSPIALAKNFWLIGQAVFVALYFAGAALMFDTLRHALDSVHALAGGKP